jgi:hypothetical protein
MTRATTKTIALTAAGLLGVSLMTACSDSGTSESVEPTESTQSSEPTVEDESDGEGSEDLDMNITQEQRDFLAELVAEPMPQDEATALIEEAGYVWRLGTIDGEPQAVTMDYRTDRLTLTVDNGLVTDGTWG